MQGAIRGTLKKKVLKFIGSEYWFKDTSDKKKYGVKGDFTCHNYEILDYVSNEVLAEVGEKMAQHKRLIHHNDARQGKATPICGNRSSPSHRRSRAPRKIKPC